MKKILRFFDKLEDKVRGAMSHWPFLYAFVGGALMIIFWRGIWHTADMAEDLGGAWSIVFYEPFTLVWTTVLMILIGLFVSFFIGDHILISGLKQEKKITEKTEKEVEEEETQLVRIENKVRAIERNLEELSSLLKK